MTQNASGGGRRLNLCITWRNCQQSIRIVQSSLHLPVMKRMLQYEVICPTNLTQFSLTAAPRFNRDRLQCCHLEDACANCNRKGSNLHPFTTLAGPVKKQNVIECHWVCLVYCSDAHIFQNIYAFNECLAKSSTFKDLAKSVTSPA